jgi:hypothetical protein
MQLEADNTDDDKRDACNTRPIAALRLNNRRALARIRSRIACLCSGVWGMIPHFFTKI